jgi:hypothetical protein
MMDSADTFDSFINFPKHVLWFIEIDNYFHDSFHQFAKTKTFASVQYFLRLNLALLFQLIC